MSDHPRRESSFFHLFPSLLLSSLLLTRFNSSPGTGTGTSTGTSTSTSTTTFPLSYSTRDHPRSAISSSSIESSTQRQFPVTLSPSSPPAQGIRQCPFHPMQPRRQPTMFDPLQRPRKQQKKLYRMRWMTMLESQRRGFARPENPQGWILKRRRHPCPESTATTRDFPSSFQATKGPIISRENGHDGVDQPQTPWQDWLR
jgi:hypothetical protein